MATMADSALSDPCAPVVPPRDPYWSIEDQAWIISRYSDVQAVLRDRSVRSRGPEGQLDRVDRRTGSEHPHLGAVTRATLLFQNSESHRALRETVRAMVATTTQRFDRPELRALAETLVERTPAGPNRDVLSTLADPLPNLIAADMLGIDEEVLRSLRRCGREVSGIWRLLPRRREYDRLEGMCAEARAALASTSLGSGRATIPSGTLPFDGAVTDPMFFLATAAVETTASTIAAALDLLAAHPTLQEKLQASPELIGAFADEVLRLAGPIRRLTPRVAEKPLTVGAVTIPADRTLILHIERAQRDPAVYAAPDAIRLDRHGTPLLAFGGGAHVCLGAVLGRMQVCAMLEAVLRRLRLAPGAERAALTGDPNLRQYARLPLMLTRMEA
jgi:nocardicin N-oxygenase